MSNLPIYQQAVDWDWLFREYPVPDIFEQSVWRWPREKVEALQERRVRETVQRGWNNPFYRELWQNAGLEQDDIQGLSDLPLLPTFTSDDIKQNQQAHPPFGSIQGIEVKDGSIPLKVQTSGGTTGKPRPTLFGPIDWEMNGLTCARALYIQGARPGDIMQLPLTNSLANLGWAYYKACHDYLGILPLTTGSGNVLPTRKQLELAFDWGTTIWGNMAEYFTHVGAVAREELGREVAELGTKFIATFLGPDIEGDLRQAIEETWGCDVYDNYGTHEMGMGAFECREKHGLHFMEDCMYFEVVDTETLEPITPGKTGNLVVTVFHRRIPPIIRYNLRDLARVISADTCGCGSNFRRMDHFLGRADEMVKLRGVNVFPMACLRAVRSDARTAGEWICVVERSHEGGEIRDDMTVQVETKSDVTDRAALHQALERELQHDLGVRVKVELVEEGALADIANYKGEGKARRLLDRRFAGTKH